MCLKRVNELLTNPVVAIQHAKKEKDMGMTLLILLFEWFLIALGTLILLKRLNLSVVVFFLGTVGTLFFGLLVQLVFTILGGKGKYFEGLTSGVYSLLPISAAVILTSIFMSLPLIGVLLSFIVSALFMLIGLSTMYRAVKELFSTDMVTSLVGMGVLFGGMMLAFYFVFILFLSLYPVPVPILR